MAGGVLTLPFFPADRIAGGGPNIKVRIYMKKLRIDQLCRFDFIICSLG
jgi:hypothetical protein